MVIERDPMKLQLMFIGNDNIGEKDYFKDFWFDANKIIGFYVPSPDDEDPDTLLLFIDGDAYRVQREKVITDYLTKHFKL
jgi:hypothetical protein